MEIEEKSAVKLWAKALESLFEFGNVVVDTNKRESKEVQRLSLTLNSFADIKQPVEFLSNSKKWLYPRFKEIESIILESDLSKSYVYSYGERIFGYGEKAINQLEEFLIPLLKKDPLSRRGIITIWDPAKDCNESIVPGLVSIDVKLRDGKVNLIALVRSNDIFIGWPANLYQLYILAKYISSRINVEIGTITTYSTSAHIFKDNYDDIKEVIKKWG